jgi:integrase/recombinase XerD
VVEAFIATRRARRCTNKYEAWLRYTLGHLTRAHRLLPARPEELEAVLEATNALSPETTHDIWSAFRMLYRWAEARLGVTNAMLSVARPIRHRRLLRTLTHKQADQLLWANQRRPRDYALIAFLLDTGARIGEAHNLTWRDVSADPDHGYTVRINGKTGERDVPITEETMHLLKRLSGGSSLWLGKRGPLTLEGLQNVVQEALHRAGLSGGPHLLRHTFGRLYVLNGGDPVSLQRIMGHASFETTRKYVALDTRDVQAQHAKFSPMARHPHSQQLELVATEGAR